MLRIQVLGHFFDLNLPEGRKRGNLGMVDSEVLSN